MRRFLALGLATLFILLAVVVAPVVYLLWAIQQPRLVFSEADPALLYALTIPGVVVELEKDRGIRALDGTVLELNRTDLTRILTRNFSEADVVAKGHAALSALAHLPAQAPPDTFQFWLDIGKERETVSGYLPGYFRRKLHSYPSCGLGDVVDMAWTGLKKLLGKDMTQEEQLRQLPVCDPPGPVEKAVLGAVRDRLQTVEARGQDTIRVRPNFSAKAHYRIRLALDLGREGSVFLPILPLLLGGIAVLSYRSRRDCYARLSAALLISALLLLVLTMPLAFFAHDLDLYSMLMAAEGKGISESTGQWLQVVFYLLKVTVRQVSYHIGLAAGVVLLAGLILLRQHRRCAVPAPAPQIDIALRGELGSRVTDQPG